jgi:hypothetical protein
MAKKSIIIRLIFLFSLIAMVAIGCGGGGGGGGDDDTSDVIKPPSGIFGTWYNDGVSDKVLIVWEDVDEAVGFNIYKLAGGANFIKVNLNPFPDNTFRPDDLEDAEYYVTSVNADGDESAPSETILVILGLTNHDSMTGVSPTDDEIDVSTVPTISWDAYPGATYYAVWLISGGGPIWGIRVPASRTSVTFGSTNGDMIIPPTENPLLSNTEYSLYIMVINSDNWSMANNRGAGGDVDKFTTE